MPSLRLQTLFQRLRHLQQRPLVRNILKVTVGNIGGNALNLIAILLLGRVLQEQYGILGTLQASMLLIAQLADLGLNLTLVKYYREEHDTHQNPEGAEALMRRLFWLRLIAVGVLGTAGWLLAGPICEMLDLEDHIVLFRLGCAGALANSLWMFAQASMQARERFTQYAVQTFFNHALRLGLILALWWSGNLSVGTAFTVMIIVPLFGAALCVPSWPALFWTARMDEAVLRAKLSGIFHFSKWILLSFIIVTINTHAAVLQLASLATEDEVAAYRMAEQLALGVSLITAAISTVLLPRMATSRRRTDIARYVRTALKLTPLLVISGLAAWLLAIPIIPRLLGAAFIPSVNVFGILVAAYLITLIISPLSFICYAFDKSHWIALTNLGQMILYLGLNALMIPLLGEIAPALITLALCIATLIVFGEMVRRLYSVAE